MRDADRVTQLVRRLEASGMTKDIGFHVEYDRTRTQNHSIRRKAG